MKENYNKIEDFLSDESFVNWVKGENNSEAAEWNEWLQQDPSKMEIVNEAKHLLNLIQWEEAPVVDEKINKAESLLRMAIAESVAPSKVISMNRRKKWYWAAAAVIIIALSLSIFSIYKSPQKMEMATRYGEINKNKLPDGTEVILNANSKLILDKDWKEGQDREVWVKGEVFFHVKKTPKRDKFIVHTDAFDIEVTGTSFNVVNEEGNSSVVLKEGSINILRPGKETIKMKPGDFVTFSNQRLQQTAITKDDYMAWTANKIVLDNTSLIELSKIIKKHYGVEVKLIGNVRNKTLTGIMPNDNLDILLQSLNAIQEFKVEKIEDTILIKGIK